METYGNSVALLEKMENLGKWWVNLAKHGDLDGLIIDGIVAGLWACHKETRNGTKENSGMVFSWGSIWRY